MEMRIVRRIAGKTLMNKERSEDIRYLLFLLFGIYYKFTTFQRKIVSTEKCHTKMNCSKN